MIDIIFGYGVEIMRLLSLYSGLSYKEINALIFLVLQPALVVGSFLLWRLEKRKNKYEENNLAQKSKTFTQLEFKRITLYFGRNIYKFLITLGRNISKFFIILWFVCLLLVLPVGLTLNYHFFYELLDPIGYEKNVIKEKCKYQIDNWYNDNSPGIWVPPYYPINFSECVIYYKGEGSNLEIYYFPKMQILSLIYILITWISFKYGLRFLRK